MGFVFGFVLLLLLLSQLYWASRVFRWIRKHVRGGWRQLAVGGSFAALLFAMIAYNAGWIGGRGTPIRLTLGEVTLGVPLPLWIACSLVSFLLLGVFWSLVTLIRFPVWIAHKAARVSGPDVGRRDVPSQPEAGSNGALESPARRVFLDRAATTVAAAPFVAGLYGVFYGRLNLETPIQRIHLRRLPAAFDGFRIAQLSDIHIGPFMTADQIRKFVAIANSFKPDLTVLTGDFVTWDAATQQAVVEALSGLKAPFGVFGCLGNHDAWADVQDSISALFGQAGIGILRSTSTPIAIRSDSFNLLGIDYMTLQPMGPRDEENTRHYMEGVENLVDPNRVNILLSHNPNTFDRAAELGIELTLAGHTHGGQVTLEFISPNIAPSRLISPYVAGLFAKPGGQLYVNRGIGTFATPIRIGAPPEITIFELTNG